MTRMRFRIFGAAVAVAVALLTAGCATGDQTLGSSSAPTASGSSLTGELTGKLTGELTIFAAASLTDSFTRLAAEFGKENPGVTVNSIDYDGSSTLVTQLKEGASADVFASADEANMKRLADAKLLSGSSSIFASNTLEIVVAPGNPKGIKTLADLATSKLLVVVCAPRVPCGAAAQSLLSLDGVKLTPASEEQNVTAVVTKVSTGVADAGLVYRTDVMAAGKSVSGVEVADAGRVVNYYTIGVPTSAKNPKVAAAFIAWILSAKGQAILAGYGFAKP